MSHLSVDSEEMAKRTDEDFNAMLQMIGEGSPIFESYSYRDDDVFERKEKKDDDDDDEEKLPETYQ